MNYVDALAARLGQLLGDCDVELLRLYALLALVKGTSVTDEDVHHAWSAWTAARRPDHRSLVPFEELSAEVRALDTRYAEAIRAVAA